MNLDLIKDLFNNLKENKIVQDFTKELSNYLENNGINNCKTLDVDFKDIDYKWNNLLSDDLVLYNKKIITKYRDKMLIERNNILQDYAKNLENSEEMYYIYNTSINQNDSYNLCIYKNNNGNEVITKSIKELPEGAELGDILVKQNENFIIDKNATKIVGEKINKMIKEEIKEQNEYLKSKRINGHIYEVGEKYSGRIWLYDLSSKDGEGIEEIDFSDELYTNAKEGNLFLYQDGEYQQYH